MGALLTRDLLYESVLLFLKGNPLRVVKCAFWLRRGKAALKARLAGQVSLNYSTLPYNRALIAFLRGEREQGRRLILVTAADQHLAQVSPDYLKLFDQVIASDGIVNLKGTLKRDKLIALFGVGGFDYVGNNHADIAVWKAAALRFAANAPKSVLEKVCAFGEVARTFDCPRRPLTVIRAIRLHQWPKNLLVFVPVITSHAVLDVTTMTRAVAAFIVFGLTASSVYVLNDLLDINEDRLHPNKRLRPMASGEVSLPRATGIIVVLLALAASIALYLSATFAMTLAAYYAISCAYSWKLKQLLLVDVFALAGLYTMRLVAGGAATGISLSFWLLCFSGFLFFSLALLKRFMELKVTRQLGGEASPGRAYTVIDVEHIGSLGVSSGMVSVLVMALYVTSAEVQLLYQSPMLLLLICPLLAFWVSRIWLLANRGLLHDDPIAFALKDRTSYVVGSLIVAVIVAAAIYV